MSNDLREKIVEMLEDWRKEVVNCVAAYDQGHWAASREQMMTRTPHVLGEHVPETCPYCGASLKSNSNPKHKYREFEYECGARGGYYEYYDDFYGVKYISVDDTITWDSICSVAEQDFQKTWFKQKRTVRQE